MTQIDIICIRLIIVLTGMRIVVAELCLLLDALLTGSGGSRLAWARGLFLVAGFLVAVLALRVRQR